MYPLEYLLALPLIAGMAGDGELDAAAEWAATAPQELLAKLGAALDKTGKPRRPDATTIGRGLAGCDQGQYDDALCAWSAARARALRPGMRRHLRIDGKAVRGAARGGRPPMLLSGVWDDGTTAAQLPVDVRKTNEIPVFRQLLKKIPDLAGAVITADQMHTQRKHARQIDAAGAFFVFTIGENQPRLFDAAGLLPWESVAGDAWTVDRGHGRIDVRTIKTLPPAERIRALFPHVEQVFLVERYSYGTDGKLLGAVAVLGITSLPADQADLAQLRVEFSLPLAEVVAARAFEGHDVNALDTDVAEVSGLVADMLQECFQAGCVIRVGVVPRAVHRDRSDSGDLAIETCCDLDVHSRVPGLAGEQVRDGVPVPGRAHGAVGQRGSLASQDRDRVRDEPGEHFAGDRAEQVPAPADGPWLQPKISPAAAWTRFRRIRATTMTTEWSRPAAGGFVAPDLTTEPISRAASRASMFSCPAVSPVRALYSNGSSL